MPTDPPPRAPSARPPVHAHERFVAKRAAFAGLDLAQRFARIKETGLWGAETSVSGLGSEWAATAAVRAALAPLFTRFGIESVLDVPCGDARWIADSVRDIVYTGIDIVPALVAAAQAHERATGGFRRFRVGDLTRDPLPRVDLILCRDCLVHLSFANIARAITQFRDSGSRYLLTTTFPALDHNADCEDGDWRGLNLERAPYGWPAPLALIDERCDEGDGGWSDKSLGLWSLADVPQPACE